MMDVNQYLGIFLEESREHLQTLNRCLLDLEHNPSDLHVLDEIFRSAHTIKGMSATMGYTKLAELTHEMENVLDLLRKGTIKAHQEIIDALFQCVDKLEQLIEDVTGGKDGSGVEVSGLVKKLTALAKGETVSESTSPSVKNIERISVKSYFSFNDTETKVLSAARNQGLKTLEIYVRLREGTVLKSVRAYMVMNALDELGDVIKAEPAVEELEKDNFGTEFRVAFVTDAEADQVHAAVINIAEIEAVEVQNSDAQLHVMPEDLQGYSEVQEAKQDEVHGASPDKKAKGRQLLRVDTDKLDSLLNLVGELVINKTRLEQIGISHQIADLVEAIEQMDRVTTDLQSVVMKLRMVPVGQVFNRFPRMVRDLSHELNKEINLTIHGEETELDRTVIDEIGDPLVHLLRNSIDHGIESPASRADSGKNPVAEIRLVARHEGNNVLLLVEDDGKGMDPKIIAKKALETGMVEKVELDRMTPDEIIRLAFLPGFSTAEKVTDVSGRGVGMDAVKTKIESLGGALDIESTVNVGTKVKIRLPLTLAIIQALLVKVSEETYAIPLGSIDSTIGIMAEDIRTVQQQEVILLRGQIIPILRLAKALKVPGLAAESETGELFVVVVQIGDNRLGVLVDSLVGQQEIVIKSLGKLLAGTKVVAGATILGDGQVVLILDVNSLTP